jgi:hypothetical protein
MMAEATPFPKADQCPICGEVHMAIPQSEACPTHGHRLSPIIRDDRWWLWCPGRGCTDGRWLE